MRFSPHTISQLGFSNLMQTVFKASWSAASSTVSKPKAWEKLGCVRMPWILVRLQALEYALLHHSHIKNPSGRYLSALSIFTISRQRSPDLTARRDPQPNAASEEMIEGACKTQWVWLLDLHELSQANFAGVTESNMRWLNMLFCGGFVQGLARGKQSTTHNMYQYVSIRKVKHIQLINVCLFHQE